MGELNLDLEKDLVVSIILKLKGLLNRVNKKEVEIEEVFTEILGMIKSIEGIKELNQRNSIGDMLKSFYNGREEILDLIQTQFFLMTLINKFEK